MPRPSFSALAVCALLALTAACNGPADPPETNDVRTVTVYSGRNESLVQPLLDRFAAEHDVEVEVRYGSTAELAATLLEEGDATPAEVFISQDAAALGALSARQLLLPLPATVRERVPTGYASPRGDWVGLSGRARVVVYNPQRITVDELPRSLEQVADPRYAGRFGIAPTNASFQAHMAAYRAVNGARALDDLLAGIVANEPQIFPKNGPIVEAVVAGEIDWGLVNHYYLWRVLAERPDAPGRNYFMPEGEISSFVNLAGAGMLRASPAAEELLAYLVSEPAQRYFAGETYEYPLVTGVDAAVDLPPLAELGSRSVDFADVAAALEPTLEAIRASGLTP